MIGQRFFLLSVLFLVCSPITCAEPAPELPSETSTSTETTPGDSSTTVSSTVDTSTTTTTTTTVDCPDPRQTDSLTVLTDNGYVAGQMDGATVAFRGIPYAQPPVGELRWQSPQDPGCWDYLEAYDFSPPCSQLDRATFAGTPTPLTGISEDCLTLNIWTPDVTGSYPVMFWIHGGGNVIGSSSELALGQPIYGGSWMAENRDVVLVSINYRLGVFAWLQHDDLEDPRGNFGTQDQVAALQWVQDNIASFGGDPDQVVIFGESAGAVNVCTLLGVPSAAGLFHGAIMQSGGCAQLDKVGTPNRPGIRELSDDLIANAGCEGAADVIACLRAIDRDTLLTTDPQGTVAVADLSRGWGPHVDGSLIPKNSGEAIVDGSAHDVPFMVGANTEENGAENNPYGDDMTEAEFLAYVQATFGATLGVLKPATYAEITSTWYNPDDYNYTPTGPTRYAHAWVALSSDLKFFCGARNIAQDAAESFSSPVYRYIFGYDGFPNLGGYPWVKHAIEIPFAFGTFNAASPIYSDGDRRVRDDMSSYWTQLAKDSDPNSGETTVAWPAYEWDGAAGTRQTMFLDDPSAAIGPADPRQRDGHCDFWVDAFTF